MKLDTKLKIAEIPYFVLIACAIAIFSSMDWRVTVASILLFIAFSIDVAISQIKSEKKTVLLVKEAITELLSDIKADGLTINIIKKGKEASSERDEN